MHELSSGTGNKGGESDVCELIFIMSNPPHNELPPWLLCLLMETLVSVVVLVPSPIDEVVGEWERGELNGDEERR
jgi:hypothetical protein